MSQIGKLDQHIHACLLSGRYRVEPDGRIVATKFRTVKRDRELKIFRDNKGYWKCHLRAPNGESRCVFLHRVIAIALQGMPANPAMEVDHVDGDKGNFHPRNLQWVSGAENMRRAYRAGLAVPHKISITEDDAKNILAQLKAGKRQRAIAREMGITANIVFALAQNRAWRHLPR